MNRNDFLRKSVFFVRATRDQAKAFCVMLVSRIRIWRYLKAGGIKKLHLGAGGNIMPGWCNTDVIPDLKTGVFLNITRKFPFADSTFEYIFTEHTIEHIPLRAGMRMLKECARVLKPGGKIRVATPDLRFLVELHNPEKTELQKREIKRIVDMLYGDVKIYQDTFVINAFFREWGHQFIYDYKVLKELMEKTGFTNVMLCQVGKSEDENLRNLEAHGKFISHESNQLQTLVMEATKP